MLTEAQKKVLTFLAGTLNEHGVEFQVSGGLGAIAYGATRPLYDIDIEIYKRDVEKVRELFKQHITVDWNNDFEPGDQFDIYMMTLVVDGVPIDINQVEDSCIISKDGISVPQAETLSYEMRSLDGLEFPVQTKEDLIAYKRLLARETDLEDIRQISA